MLFTQDATFIAHFLQSSYFSLAAGSRLITNLKLEVRNRVCCFLHPEDYGSKVTETQTKRKKKAKKRRRKKGKATKKNRRKKKRKITKTRSKRTPKMKEGTCCNSIMSLIKFLGEKPWVRGQFQFRTQVIGLSLNALDNNINSFKK